MKEHPEKQKLVAWLQGVKIESFLKSYSKITFQGRQIQGYYPPSIVLENYVPKRFGKFITETITMWHKIGMLQKWEEVRDEGDSLTPTVILPLGVEPKIKSHL